MITIITLFLEFFKTGLLAVGGGLATLPFLHDLVKYGWYTKEQLMDMIAVAESTPGPIGVNMATYAGFNGGGLIGGIAATIGLVTPSVIVIILVYKILEKFKNSSIVEDAFYGLRPAVAGLISVAVAELFRLTLIKDKIVMAIDGIFDLKALLVFAVLTLGVFKFKKLHPLVFILIGAAAGIIFKM